MRVFLTFAALASLAQGSPVVAQTASFGATNANPWVATLPHTPHHHEYMKGRVHHGFPGLYASYGYAGYNDYGDFDGNRSFDPDKWNDWWHDRPDRAYPRWMTRNSDCARRWFSGNVLTC